MSNGIPSYVNTVLEDLRSVLSVKLTAQPTWQGFLDSLSNPDTFRIEYEDSRIQSTWLLVDQLFQSTLDSPQDFSFQTELEETETAHYAMEYEAKSTRRYRHHFPRYVSDLTGIQTETRYRTLQMKISLYVTGTQREVIDYVA